MNDNNLHGRELTQALFDKRNRLNNELNVLELVIEGAGNLMESESNDTGLTIQFLRFKEALEDFLTALDAATGAVK